MKPVDLRNSTFAVLRNGLGSARMAVYEAWITHGPATTRELSSRSGIDILTLRPRTTELYILGLVELVDVIRGSEGIYRAVLEKKWSAWHKNHVIGQQQLI